MAKMGSVNGMFNSEERKVLYKEVVGVRRRFGFFWTLDALLLLYSDFIC